MNDQMQSLKDDIAFMRALAEEGRTTPPLGGAILASAGLLFGLASIGQWAILSRVLNIPYNWLAGVWGAALVLFLITLLVLRGKLATKPGAFSPANKAGGAAWQGIGIAIFISFFAMTAAAWKTHNPGIINFSPSIILLFYGVGWTVDAAMTGRRWMNLCAWGSFLAAVGVAFLIDSPLQYLAYAGCLFALATAPGVILMRQEPSDIV